MTSKSFTISQYANDEKIHGDKLQQRTVEGNRLELASVNTNELANNAVTNAKLADGSVSASKIQNNDLLRTANNLSEYVSNPAPVLANLGLTNVAPIGSVVYYLGGNAPSGWLELNGTTIAPAAAPFAATHKNNVLETLFKMLWVMGDAEAPGYYGPTMTLVTKSSINVNDAWSLNNYAVALPDTRGEFIRVWAHGATTDPNSNRPLGSKQTNSLESHNHTLDAVGDHNHGGSTDAVGAHTHAGTATLPFVGTEGGPSGPINGLDLRYLQGLMYSVPNVSVAADGGHSHNVSIHNGGGHGHTLHATGGVETRPRNIALMAIIKY